MKIHSLRSALAAAGILCAAGQMFATQLAPGGTANNPAVAAKPAGSPIAENSDDSAPGSLTEGFSWKSGKIAANGVYVNDVYQGTGGNLDFYYQIQNNTVLAKNATAATKAESTLTPSFQIAAFQGFGNLQVFQLTDASKGNFFGVQGGDFVGPTSDTVTSVSLSPAGTLTVDLSGTGIAPGQNSAVLLIEATSNDFDQDGESTFNWNQAPPAGAKGVASTDQFDLGNLEPVNTPEPGFYGVLALGVTCLLFTVRRRSIKAIPAV